MLTNPLLMLYRDKGALDAPCSTYTMVKAILKDTDTVIAESSDTVFIEGNHYFPAEAIKVDLPVSDTT